MADLITEIHERANVIAKVALTNTFTGTIQASPTYPYARLAARKTGHWPTTEGSYTATVVLTAEVWHNDETDLGAAVLALQTALVGGTWTMTDTVLLEVTPGETEEREPEPAPVQGEQVWRATVTFDLMVQRDE